jgi:hypothetical protein
MKVVGRTERNCGVRNAEWGKKIKKEEARRIPEI